MILIPTIHQQPQILLNGAGHGPRRLMKGITHESALYTRQPQRGQGT
ncbi:hypothetical protein ATL17_0961 [Maritalea mobilis]|uniref:Uncharacterized protein n=1 Tax=Maritalea mobilis TaxID=483324 RepID=A0A4R6W1X2_9HYPH|nr:hypothetical protein ATL17_0961 [Maritalea mobilis]